MIRQPADFLLGCIIETVFFGALGWAQVDTQLGSRRTTQLHISSSSSHRSVFNVEERHRRLMIPGHGGLSVPFLASRFFYAYASRRYVAVHYSLFVD
jgi:hypothetical protein